MNSRSNILTMIYSIVLFAVCTFTIYFIDFGIDKALKINVLTLFFLVLFIALAALIVRIHMSIRERKNINSLEYYHYKYGLSETKDYQTFILDTSKPQEERKIVQDFLNLYYKAVEMKNNKTQIDE